ncbi:hypothetical protein FA15DRAFT_371680 [Coprinopsis marcescibilis]|uniref:Uncharacterized protein n=1 Tax=Coprinopsis marcescibilis TaxID=230819 RepID=A0A5C3KA68_COPMA|nr:hypothetical protein FA15DRAFT_371680 [Coprinopsis marcescibilis]
MLYHLKASGTYCELSGFAASYKILTALQLPLRAIITARFLLKLRIWDHEKQAVSNLNSDERLTTLQFARSASEGNQATLIDDLAGDIGPRWPSGLHDTQTEGAKEDGESRSLGPVERGS